MYCRHCGREAATTKQNCMYCGLGLTRAKTARRCPFCAEEIQADAVKCRHCGEFVDARFRQGQPQPGAAPPVGQQPPQNVQIFVIDKALVHTNEDMQVAGGQSVPPNLARQLPQAAVKAIEANAPHMLPHGPVRALPPPPEPEGIDAEPGEAPPGAASRDAEGRLLIEAPALELEPWKKRIPKVAGRVALVAGRKLAEWTWLLLKWTGRKGRERWQRYQAQKEAERQAAAQAEAEEPLMPSAGWYDCPHCQTEVHPLDNYCYLCGNRLRRDAPGRPEPGKPLPDAPTSKAAQAAIVFAIFGFVPIPPLGLPAAVLGVLFATIALFSVHRARPRIKGKGLAIAALAIAIAWLGILELKRSGRIRVDLPLQQNPAAGGQQENNP